MGSFYVNFSVKGIRQADLARFLRERKIDAYVGPAQNGWCSFSDSVTEGQDSSEITQLGASLSLDLQKSVLCVLNHDDDVLSIDLFQDGSPTAEYNSCPGYFDMDPSPERLQPRFSGVEDLAKLGTNISPVDLREILTDDGALAVELHERLAAVLDLPKYSVGFGYRYVAGGEFEDLDQLVHTSRLS
jgi:hypothetical protein